MGNSFTVDTGSIVNSKNTEDLWPYIWAIREPECLDWKNGLEDEEIEVLALRQHNLPVPITKTLYLSGRKDVCDVDKLDNLGITHVLNVAGVCARGPLDLYKDHNITYKEIDAHDEEGYNMLGNHLEECQAFIQLAASAGGKCVVHCVAGINRSGVIAAAVHMLSEAPSSNVLTTVAHCRRQRSNCFLWNHSFQAQLVLLAEKQKLMGPLPGQTGCCVAHQAPPPPQDTDPKAKSIASLF